MPPQPPQPTQPQPPHPLARRADKIIYVTTGPPYPVVPLWAFIIMTIFTLLLMVLVAVLLWRPELVHSRFAGRPMAQEEKSDEYLLPNDSSSPSRPASRWLRATSFRRNINRWRSGVQPNNGRESFAMGDDVDLSRYNYSPAPARPLSSLQRIPEGDRLEEPEGRRLDPEAARMRRGLSSRGS